MIEYEFSHSFHFTKMNFFSQRFEFLRPEGRFCEEFSNILGQLEILKKLTEEYGLFYNL